ncbi:hypothetical protein [Leekyejoonella antrihumi]|uniref:hypothetical protein n=1 Tax=Leekyejoonella antrihumi TaxID=1660198 RepID=UPI001FE5B07A|nr:hypothetical protein [Leekyejoonella antrihumi]
MKGGIFTMQEQQPQEQNITDQPEAEQHFKTLAVRVEEGLHARLRFLAQLNETSISEEIRTALEQRITSAQEDPNVIAKAEQARAEVERQAAARSEAIAGFIGKSAVTGSAAKSRRTTKTNNQ